MDDLYSMGVDRDKITWKGRSLCGYMRYWKKDDFRSGDRYMKNRKFSIFFGRFLLEENMMFFMDDSYSCLFQYDCKSENIKFLHSFRKILNNKNIPAALAEEIAEYNGKIFIFVSGYGFIICYDTSNEQETPISIPFVNGKEFRICRVITEGAYAWIFSFNLLQGIYVLDMKENCLIWEEFGGDKVQWGGRWICEGVYIKEKRCLFTGIYNTSTVLEIDFANKKISDFDVPVMGLHLENVGYAGDIFYMVQIDSSDILVWNRKKDSVIRYVDTQPRWAKKKEIEVPYHDIICMDGEVYFFPWFGDKIIKLDRNGGYEEKMLDIAGLGHGRSQSAGSFYGYKIMGEQIWFSPFGFSAFVLYDIQTGATQIKKVEIDSKHFSIYQQVIKSLLGSSGKFVLSESELILLYDLLNLMLGENISAKKNVETEFGKKIFLEMMH